MPARVRIRLGAAPSQQGLAVGMIGVMVPIPVPMAVHSFGGGRS